MSVVEYNSFSQFKEFIETKHKNIDDILGKPHFICPYLYGGKYLLVNIMKENASYKTFLEKQEQLKSNPTFNYHIYYDEEFVSLFTDDLSLMLRLENIIN